MFEFKPFTEKMLNYSNIFSEVSTSLLFSVILIYQFNITEESRNNIDESLIAIVYSIMAGNMFFHIILSFNLVVKIIKNRSNDKVSPGLSNDSENSIARNNSIADSSENQYSFPPDSCRGQLIIK